MARAKKIKKRRRPLPMFSKAGVDLTQVRWMLSLTPAERLHACQSFVNEVLRIRALNARA